MYKKLQDVADVVAGFPFREAIVPDKNGGIFILQPKNIDPLETVKDLDELTRIDMEVSGNSFLQYGDILIIARGMKSGAFRATIFKCKIGNVVTPSSVHIIRIKDKAVLPEYLSIYLNSFEGQNEISKLISGSYIGALPRSSLARMKVPIPSLQIQKSIIDLHQNIQQQDRILERKRKLKKNIINATFKNLITK